MDSVVIPSIAEDADEFLSYNNYSAKFALLARNSPPMLCRSGISKGLR